VVIRFGSPSHGRNAGKETRSVLEIIAQGAWNGGTYVDNTLYENRGMFFKGGIPVADDTIQSRVGVRTRVAAPEDERIGRTSFEHLLENAGLDTSRIKVVIGATNVGDDKTDRGPQIRHSVDLIRRYCPEATVFDLYAGCPGFNVSVELLLAMSRSGRLGPSDLSVIVGAENIHRARAFKALDTANVIFGDDSMATALETTAASEPLVGCSEEGRRDLRLSDDVVESIATSVAEILGNDHVDGIIIDNQLGNLELRVPASAARVQHRVVELIHPQEARTGVFERFKDALEFYDRHVNSFAYDIMSLEGAPEVVWNAARAHVESGRQKCVVAVFIAPDRSFEITVHRGRGGSTVRGPDEGVVDAMTRTHGCFANYIQAIVEDDELFGEMNGKGVFLYATRGVVRHLADLFARNGVTVFDIDLMIEHQANFAMIPATVEQVLAGKVEDVKAAAAEFVADKMVTNIHRRGNCSVVCMQRLPYDLERGALETDTVQGYAVNRDLATMRQARTVLYDSVGAGMTRSSFLLRRGSDDRDPQS
jgi:3-oxoacyl-[acyl-carrier-protein] synthase III